MKKLFNNNDYLIELLTPKQNIEDFDAALEKFHERYQKILNEGGVVSLPDNPMGTLHFTPMEVISYLELPIKPESLIVHLNSFHRKVDLDEFLDTAQETGVRYILCVSGDGGPKLPKLEPEDLGMEGNTVTSVELLHYIKREYPDTFTLGAAFNQYEPLEHELDKLRWKIEAGAEFIITQPAVAPSVAGDPAVGREKNLEHLTEFDLPVYIGAWMSKKIELISDCVGYDLGLSRENYVPAENLKELHKTYPRWGVYLSLLSFSKEWRTLLPRLERKTSAA